MSDANAEATREEQQRRKNAKVEYKQRSCGHLATAIASEKGLGYDVDCSEMPMVQELAEILGGKWSGISHWTIDD